MNTNRGFGLTGTDFVVLADMTDNATFLGEINLQTGRGGSSDLELDVERFFVNYRIDPRFNVQAGLFFTPIGYNNRFLYARAWLMNSIQVPDFFEEELNLFPTHSIGVAAHGAVRLRATAIASPTSCRRPTAVRTRRTAPSTPATTPPTRRSPVCVEWLIPGFKDSRVGVSGWFGNIDSVRVERAR